MSRSLHSHGVLRVHVDSVGYIGPVEVSPTTTLAELRRIIATSFDAESIPQYYVFLGKGSTVGSNKESSLLASEFRPGITLLPTDEHPVAVSVSVRLWTGATFSMWALPSCTVHQLRTEASRFWRLNPADTVLSTEDAALWPDSALVHACLALPASAGGAGASAPGTAAEGRGAGGGMDGRSDSQSGPTSPLATSVATPSVKGPNAPRSFPSATHFYLHLRDSSMEKLFDHSSFPSSLPLTSEQGGGRPRQRTRGLSGDGRRSIVGSPAAGRSGGGRVSIAAGAGGVDSSFIDDFGEAGGEDDGGEVSSRASRSHSRRVRHSVAGSHAGASSTGDATLPPLAEHGHAGGPQRISGKRAREEETPVSVLFRHMARGLPSSQYSALLPLVGLEDGLWRAFTWYGTQGDARDPFHVRSRQWRRLLHDCGLLQGSDAAAPAVVQQLSWEHADVLFSACQATSRRGAVHVSHGGTLNSVGGGLGATMDSGAADFGSPTEGSAGGGPDGDSIIPSMATLAARQAKEGGSHGSTKHERATTGLDYITFMRALVAVAVYCCGGQSTNDDGVTPAHPGLADAIPPVPSVYITGCRHGDALHALSVILSSPTAGLLTLAPALARLDSGNAGKDPSTSSPWMPPTSGGASGGGAGLPSRTLDTDRVQALVTLLGDILLPRAGCWPLARWRQEGRVLGMNGTALDALLEVGRAGSGGRQQAGTSAEDDDASAVQGTMLAELHRFVPALYLLFSYYCDAPCARVASLGLPPVHTQAGGSAEEPRGYTAIHAARQRSAEPPHKEAGHATQGHGGDEERQQEEGAGSREREEEEAVRGHDGTSSVRSGATKASAMNQYMEQLRQAAAEERARAYNRPPSNTEPTVPITASNANTSSKVGGVKASSKAASRLDMQSQGYSPNSVLAGSGSSKLQAVARGRAGRGGYAAAHLGFATGKEQRGSQPNTKEVKMRAAPVSQALHANIAVTAAAVRAVPLPPPLAPSPSASPSRHTPSATAVLADEEASVSYDSFLKFCSECGLTDLSSLGNIPPLPARQVTEVFLASACLGVGDALGRMAAAAAAKGKGKQQGGMDAALSAVANGVPDPYTDRLRLGWPQFLSCVCRLALTLGQHILALPQKELSAGEAYSDVDTALLEQVSLSVSLAAVSPILRMRALMQVLSIGLSQAQRLQPLLTSRRDTLSASSDKLLRGIQAFHIAYSSLGKDIGGCVDHGMLLVAYCHAAVGTGVLQRAHAALLGQLHSARGQRKRAAAESKEESLREEVDEDGGRGGGAGGEEVAAVGEQGGQLEGEEEVEYAVKAAWLVEGRGQGHRTGGMMQVSAARGGSKSPGKRRQAARRRVMHPPVFASDLVRFAGLSQEEAVALAAAVAAGRKTSAMAGQGDSGGDQQHAVQEADVSMLPGDAPTPAHALTVRVSALAALDTVWKEQQEIKASTGKLLQARQQDAKAASQAISQQRLLARMAMSERRGALPPTPGGPGVADVHATAPSTSAMLQQTEEYAAYVRESELERRRAVWAELQRARVEVASAVQSALSRQQLARRGVMPPPYTEQQQSDEQQGQAQAFAIGAREESHVSERIGGATGAGTGAGTGVGRGAGVGSKDSGRSGSGSPHRTASPDPFVRMGSYPRSASMASLDRLLQHHGATGAGAGVGAGVVGQGHRGLEGGSNSSGDHTESHGLPPLGSFLSLAGGRRQPGHSPLPSPALSPPVHGLLHPAQPLPVVQAGPGTTAAQALASAVEGGTEEDDTAGDSGSYSSRSGGQGGRGGVPPTLADPSPPVAPKALPGGGPTLHGQHSEDTSAHTFGRETTMSSHGFLSSTTGSLSTLGSPTMHTQPPSSVAAAAAASAAYPHPHPHQASGAGPDRAEAAPAQAPAGSVPPLQRQASATVVQVPVGSGHPSHTPAQQGGTGGAASSSGGGGGLPAASERNDSGQVQGGQAQGGGGGRARSGAIDASARDRPVKPVSTPPQQSQAGGAGGRAREASPEAQAGRQAEAPSKPGEVLGAPSGRPQSLKSALAPAAASSTTGQATGVGEQKREDTPSPSPPKPAAPASDPRARDIVERRLKWKRMLLEGAVFMKFGRWGKPHPRVVWLDGDCEAVRWRKVDSTAGPRDARTEVIVVADISEVLEGPSTSVFSRNSKSITNPACCFSVVTPARTLDLMAESKEQKEDWVTALLALKKYKSFI